MQTDLTPEVIDRISTLAVNASNAAGKVAFLNCAAEPDHVYAVVKSDGSYEMYDASPQPRNHQIVGLAEMVGYIANECDESSSIWFDRDGVVALIDDKTRRDRATLKLKTTPQLDLLASLDKQTQEMDQRAFRRLLKNSLRGCIESSTLLDWVSSCKFDTAATAGGTIGKQRESLGRDIQHEAISSLGECPDEVVLQVRVFDDPWILGTQTIRCGVEIMLQEQRFALKPFPLEVHNAIEREVENVGAAIRDGANSAPVYRGRP